MAAWTPPGHGRPDEDGADRIVPSSSPALVRALAFWSAVLLPFLHVPLLTTGLESTGQRQAFMVLLGLNAAALYVGHTYGYE